MPFTHRRENCEVHDENYHTLLPQVNSFNSTGINRMVPNIPSFVRLTPFGPYCGICEINLSIEKGILNHGRTFHSDTSFKNAVVVRAVKSEIENLQSIHADDLSLFLKLDQKPEVLWFCNVCFLSFFKRSNYYRHLAGRYSKCGNSNGRELVCFPTVCGRKGPKKVLRTCPAPRTTIVEVIGEASNHTVTNATVSTCISVEVPATLMQSHDEAIRMITPFVRSDETASDLSLIYLPLLGPSFEGTIREFLQFSSKQSLEDPVLSNWLKAGEIWLTKYAACHISNVSGNVRNRLAEFEQRELDGTMVGTRTFTLRRGIPRLIGELLSALRFFYRYPTSLFNKYKSHAVKCADEKWMIQNALIPRILHTAASEEPGNHGQLPVVCKYCLSRGFSVKSGNELTMNECGWFSSRISAVMHLLRAGVCGYLVTLAVKDSSRLLSMEELEIVRLVQHGRVTNMLAPYVKRLRELNARKPPLKDNTVNGNGDITSGAFSFPKSVWSTIIPRVLTIAKATFREVFLDDTWEKFLDESVSVVSWTDLVVYVYHSNCQIFLQDLLLKVDENSSNALFCKLQAIGELCLFGFGAGAVRFEELCRLKTTSSQWHNSYMYFWTESQKKGSMRGSSLPTLIEHRLSLSLSKMFLLIRKVLLHSPRLSETNLLPNLPEASMLCLVCDIFDFEYPPSLLNVRHLFTSIGNVILPENTSALREEQFVSAPILSEKSGHTQGTARRSYSTILQNSEEAIYDKLHKELGERSLDAPEVDFVPFPITALKASLRELLRKKATFRNEAQKK